MTAVQDDELLRFAERINGKVVIITGAANGIGRATALLFGSKGAKVVVGDIDDLFAEDTASIIRKRGGEGIALRCDVSKWDDQVAMFETAIGKYGSVDIVVANAGVGEIGNINVVEKIKGIPLKPSTKTIEVNIIGTIYTTHLAIHYFHKNRTGGSLKSLVVMGSMASWVMCPEWEMYTATKHGVLGLMRSLTPAFQKSGVRIACICPWFSDTNLLPNSLKVTLAGLPMTPVDRIAGSIFYSASDIDMETNGSVWMLMDDGPLVRVEKEQLKKGIYEMLDNRINSLFKAADGLEYYAAVSRDLMKVFGKKLLIFGLVVGASSSAWISRYRVGALWKSIFSS